MSALATICHSHHTSKDLLLLGNVFQLVYLPPCYAHSQCLSQLVSQQEKELYGETDRDLVQDKMKAAQAGMKTLVQAQNIGADAKDYLIKQVRAGRVVSLTTKAFRAETNSAFCLCVCRTHG